jgi:hypothetical protein
MHGSDQQFKVSMALHQPKIDPVYKSMFPPSSTHIQPSSVGLLLPIEVFKSETR